MNTFLSFLYLLLIRPLVDVAIIAIPLLIFGVIIRVLKGRIDDILLYDFGPVPYYCFSFIGTPIHEASHLIASFVFRHKIKRFSLFSPDSSGRLGFVEHAYDPNSLYQRIGCFFIGIAPIAGGCMVLFVLTRLFLPHYAFPEGAALAAPGLLRIDSTHHVWQIILALKHDVVAIMASIWMNPPPMTWRTLLYIFLVVGIGSHMFPSSADFAGMLPGILVLYLFLCVLDLGLHLLQIDIRTLLEGYITAAGVGVNFLLFVVLLLLLCLLMLFVGRIIWSWIRKA